VNRAADNLREHAAACAECRETPLPIDRIVALLDAGVCAVDATSLSKRVLLQAQPLLQRAAMARFWRQVATVIVIALTPLPVILAYDAYLLGLLHAAAATLLPSPLATYLVASYALSLLFLFALSYAAIPILVARNAAPRFLANG
jgi:hypothetical protein